MKIKHLAGSYYLKYRGRGVIRLTLTSQQAKVLFDLMGRLEIEELTHEDYL